MHQIIFFGYTPTLNTLHFVKNSLIKLKKKIFSSVMKIKSHFIREFCKFPIKLCVVAIILISFFAFIIENFLKNFTVDEVNIGMEQFRRFNN